jgi:limonene 1,2-monooxygenase
MADRLRFGMFLPPYHARNENPTLALHRDLWLVEHIDRLGYDEVWVGEHHSAAFETIGAPEMFIATAAERTRNIRLGTGVVSLPYHQPLMVAERINYLDHITRGRVMFGVGPGALPSDASMMGIPVEELRPRMEQALDVLIPLLRGETVSAEAGWFTLKDARLQMLPYSQPSVEMAITAMASQNSAIAAGKYGLGVLQFLSVGTFIIPSLAQMWALTQETAAKHGKTVERSQWRMVLQMHIAESREQAMEDVRFGFEQWVDYLSGISDVPMPAKGADKSELIQAFIDSGAATIGTPDDAIAAIERYLETTGGFGCAMLMAHNWANSRATADSYELIARYVMPHFQRSNINREVSIEEVIAKRRQQDAGKAQQHGFDKARGA